MRHGVPQRLIFDHQVSCPVVVHAALCTASLCSAEPKPCCCRSAHLSQALLVGRALESPLVRVIPPRDGGGGRQRSGTRETGSRRVRQPAAGERGARGPGSSGRRARAGEGGRGRARAGEGGSGRKRGGAARGLVWVGWNSWWNPGVPGRRVPEGREGWRGGAASTASVMGKARSLLSKLASSLAR